MRILSFLSFFMLLQSAVHAQVPHASFASKTRVCANIDFAITSTSTGADSYEWFVNGIHYSYDPDTILSIFTFCTVNKELKLVATNTISGLTDTLLKTILVTSNVCNQHLDIDYEACPGDTITYAGNPDASQYYWAFNQQQNVVSGCDTCNHISFVMITHHPTLTLTQSYDGGCMETLEYTAYFCPNNTSVSDAGQDNKVSIVPNPVKDRSVLHFSNPANKKHQLSLYNMEGKLVSRQDNITGSELTIERKDMPAGIYFYRLVCEDGRGMSGKIMME